MPSQPAARSAAVPGRSTRQGRTGPDGRRHERASRTRVAQPANGPDRDPPDRWGGVFQEAVQFTRPFPGGPRSRLAERP